MTASDAAGTLSPTRVGRVHRRVAALVRLARRVRARLPRVAHMMRLAPTTLRGWIRTAGQCARRTLRGRPPRQINPETFEEVDEVLAETRGRIGLRALRKHFAGVPRAALEMHVRAWRTRHARHRERLCWTTPGTVWAADWTELDVPVTVRGERCRWVLVVRDLAGATQLLALPAVSARACVAAEAIEALFHVHGAPLVLKTDNGSNVARGEVEALLREHAVTHLRSPAATPRYNGAVEAGIGSLKARLRAIAASNGRADQPTCDDLEQARLEANDEARARSGACEPETNGIQGLSPDEHRNAHAPVTALQRRLFNDAVERATREHASKLAAARWTAGAAPASTDDQFESLGASDRAIVARRAIRQALETLGYLTSRRTAISSTHHSS